MKPQVLFVDDEPLILQGLQRSLRGMRGDWEMTFLDSGAAALAFMESHPVDVIVSDMRMPAMNGVQLLSEVMKRYPKTVRLILSGHADQDLILQCVGSTHQYLSKPCNPEQLRATVRRAMDLESQLNNERLQELVGEMEHIPSIPSLYSEIVDKMHDPDTTVEDIGQIIAKDIGMTAKILKLVNSAFFGVRQQVVSPCEAVAYLGIDTIKSLVLSTHAFSQFETIPIAGFSLTALWNHSLRTAAAAKRIAQAESQNRKVADEAFVAGLLHDAGKMALAFNFPEQYGKILAQPGQSVETRLREERALFGATHACVGGYLLGLWGLPTPVVEAITLHHLPHKSMAEEFDPLAAVHIANAIVNADAGIPEIDRVYLERLNLGNRLGAWQQIILSTDGQ